MRADMQSEKTIETVLSDLQTRISVGKDKYNDFGGYAYRSADDILNAIKPILSEHASYVILDDDVKFIEGRFYIKATATLHAYGGFRKSTAYAREAEHKTKTDDAQLTGMASAYARKYALCGLLAISDGNDDPDGKKPEQTATNPDNKASKHVKECKRLWKAVNAYTANTEYDAVETYQAVFRREDFKDTAEYINRMAAWYEAQVKQPNQSAIDVTKFEEVKR